MLRKLLLLAVLFFLFACSEETQNPQASQTQPASPVAVSSLAGTSDVTTEADHFLVFFLDPNGGPCRMQNSILEGMTAELKGKVNLRYVKTTIPEDRQYFYDYGIRGLPSLLLADASGKEIKRLSPGVNPVEAVRQLLTAVPN